MALIPFDDRDGFIWMDGEMLPWREAKMHYLTHALHYGTQVFEGERAYNGKIFKSREHSDRLLNSAKIIRMPMEYTAEEIDEMGLPVRSKGARQRTQSRDLLSASADVSASVQRGR